MNIIKARNVNHAYFYGREELACWGARMGSRNGDVIVAPWPVVTVYENPCERVLFDEVRDANPFFHLMEALWMLAGRDDAAFLNHYIRDFGTRYSEEGGYIHGAYGMRWRSAMGFDQLDHVVAMLRRDPTSRQAVIQMWDCRTDEYNVLDSAGCDDLRGDFKDRPCNTHLYLRVREVRDVHEGGAIRDAAGGVIDYVDTTEHVRRELDMTICCRSNDAVWGAHGANAVHFSVLLEYLAGRIGVGVGKMYQISNNFHGYVGVLGKMPQPDEINDPYENAEVYSTAMATDWGTWDEDLRHFMRWHDVLYATPYDSDEPAPAFPPVSNAWFRMTACRVAFANWHRVNKNVEMALRVSEKISAPDWRRACGEWLQRREKTK